MKRVLLGALLLAPLAACGPTYVNEARPPAYGSGSTYAPAPSYGGGSATRDSYEAERRAYEQGRRDGARGGTSFWR